MCGAKDGNGCWLPVMEGAHGAGRTGWRKGVEFCLGFMSWRCPWVMQGEVSSGQPGAGGDKWTWRGGGSLETYICGS